MDNPVYITAQEAAERLLTIKIAGCLLLIMALGLIAWVIIRWKYTEDRRTEEAETAKIEAENARERIRVTENIGTAMTEVLKQDSGWKAQYYILKAKYDALTEHNENLEQTLASAEAGKFIPKEAK